MVSFNPNFPQNNRFQGGFPFGGTQNNRFQGGFPFGGTQNNRFQGGFPFGGAQNNGFQGGSPFGGTQNDRFQGGFPFGGGQTGGFTPPQKPSGAEIDTNADGAIDQSELLAFSPTDPDGNTLQIPDEMKQQLASRILNGQTSISTTDFDALQPPPPPPLGGAQTGGFTPPQKPTGAEIDTNADGAIDQSELLAFSPTDPDGNTLQIPDEMKQQLASRILNGQTSISTADFDALQPPPPPPPFAMGENRFSPGNASVGNFFTSNNQNGSNTRLANVTSQLQTLINTLLGNVGDTTQNADIATQLQSILDNSQSTS